MFVIKFKYDPKMISLWYMTESLIAQRPMRHYNCILEID